MRFSSNYYLWTFPFAPQRHCEKPALPPTVIARKGVFCPDVAISSTQEPFAPSVIARRSIFCSDEAIFGTQEHWEPQNQRLPRATTVALAMTIPRSSHIPPHVIVENPNAPPPSLRGGALFAPTKQSLVPKNRTNGNEGSKKKDCHGSQNEPRNDEREDYCEEPAFWAT